MSSAKFRRQFARLIARLMISRLSGRGPAVRADARPAPRRERPITREFDWSLIALPTPAR